MAAVEPHPTSGAASARRQSRPGVLALAVAVLALVVVMATLLAVGHAGLRAHTDRWQARLADLGAAPATPRLEATAHQDYAQVLQAADRLHRVLNGQVVRHRERVRELERLEAGLVGGMVLLALASILVMAWIGRQQAALAEQTRRLAEESEARRRAVERVSEEKARFIRGITHDLKNPLGAVDAYAELLQAEIKGALTDEQRQYVGRIRSAVQQVLGTIQDLLELARAEAEGLRIERRPVDVREVVRTAVEDYRAALEAGGLSLRVDVAPRLPRVETDPRRVAEILGNLLSNALKYTPAGGRVSVRAAVRAEGPRGDGEWVVVEVQDTGPGIPPEAQERIFEEFQRLNAPGAEGSGLGLAISRRMARLMDGEVTVTSRAGEGSTFALWLPLQRTDAGHPSAPAA